MSEPPQAGLDTADDQRDLWIGFPDHPAIDLYSTIWPQTFLTAGRIGVMPARFFGGSIVIDHGIDIAAANDKSQTRLAKDLKIAQLPPIRLGQDTDTEAFAF